MTPVLITREKTSHKMRTFTSLSALVKVKVAAWDSQDEAKQSSPCDNHFCEKHFAKFPISNSENILKGLSCYRQRKRQKVAMNQQINLIFSENTHFCNQLGQSY